MNEPNTHAEALGPAGASLDNETTEQAAVRLGCNAPRVSAADLEANIVEVEIVKHVSRSGQVLRWAILTTRSGFAVTGEPSAAVSAENDRAELGEKYAIENARRALWRYMAYALRERLHEAEFLARLQLAEAGDGNVPTSAQIAARQREILDRVDLARGGIVGGGARQLGAFRKKPVIIQARQFETNNDAGGCAAALVTWVNGNTGRETAHTDGTAIFIRTLEGEMRADVSDWIIRGVKGEFYPCKADIFAATYDPA